MNVPTNLNLLQNVLLCMPYDDLSIVMLLKRKLEFIYMIGYVHPNILIKVVLQLCQTPLNISAKISIRSNWEDLIEFANACKTLISNVTLLKMMSMKKILTNLT